VISHNLRGPMSRIQGLAAIIDLARDEAERKDIAHKMSLSSYELDQVIKDLTMITDIRNVQDKPIEKLEIQKVLDNVLLMLKPEIEAAHARIEIKLQVDSIRSILSYLENVLYNLLSNAIKFRDVKRPLFIRITSYRRHEYIILEIKDNGLGIDMQRYRDQLFIPYKRFHYHVEGKGLGLYLAKTQTEAMDGNLEVDSEAETGSTFRMLFRESV
jgi:signal transduction histidine kinase